MQKGTDRSGFDYVPEEKGDTLTSELESIPLYYTPAVGT